MIKYIDGMKYQLAETYICKTPITGEFVEDDFFTLQEDGTLIVYKGFGWDGASGPTFDSPSSMRPSLVHDCFCIAMRNGKLDYNRWHKEVNQLFHDQCLEDGMWHWRANLWHSAVEFADAGNPDQGADREVKTAP